VCLDVVPGVGSHFGEALELRGGVEAELLHEGAHPADARGHALPRQA